MKTTEMANREIEMTADTPPTERFVENLKAAGFDLMQIAEILKAGREAKCLTGWMG